MLCKSAASSVPWVRARVSSTLLTVSASELRRRSSWRTPTITGSRYRGGHQQSQGPCAGVGTNNHRIQVQGWAPAITGSMCRCGHQQSQDPGKGVGTISHWNQVQGWAPSITGSGTGVGTSNHRIRYMDEHHQSQDPVTGGGHQQSQDPGTGVGAISHRIQV
jgi:hypothetical protein